MIVPSLAMRQFLLDHGIRKAMKFVIQEMWDNICAAATFRAPGFRKEFVYTDGGSFDGMQG